VSNAKFCFRVHVDFRNLSPPPVSVSVFSLLSVDKALEMT
jgi:hypothetical protein